MFNLDWVQSTPTPVLNFCRNFLVFGGGRRWNEEKWRMCKEAEAGLH